MTEPPHSDGPDGSEPARAASWADDAVLAVAVAVVLASVITIAQASAGQAPALLSYLFAGGFGAVLLLRRQRPVLVLVLSVLGTFVYYALELPAIGVALPVVAALYSAAEQGVMRWAIGAGAITFAVSLSFRLRDDPQPMGSLLSYDAVTNIALIAAAIALGYATRSHRRGIAQQRQIARLRERQTQREAQLRLRDERERISRELHDTIGHSLSVISLHTGVAADAVGQDDAGAREAIDRVRAQATESLQELRSMVRLLREEGSEAADGECSHHVRSLAEAPTVLDRARAAGLRVEQDLAVEPGQLSPAVDTAAYRVIQEAVTNALRHAGAASLTVTTHLEAGRLRILVTDDGRGASSPPLGADTGDGTVTDGVGLLGMRERVRLLGGTLAIRTAAGAGFTVEAVLPARLGP